MKGIPRRHHYVTRAYLENFLDLGEKHLYCYGRKKREPFRTTPENLANIRDFHSLRRPDGSLDFSLEIKIEREIETPGIPLIRQLASGNTNLSRADRELVSRLITLQDVRVPYERNFMDSHYVGEMHAYLADMDSESKRLGVPVNALEVAISLNPDPASIKEWTRITRAQVLAALEEAEEDPTRSSLEGFFSLANSVAGELAKMQWTIHRIQGAECFITSDRPVVKRSVDRTGFGRGITDSRSVVLFPLSATALLEARHRNWMLEAIRKRRPNLPKARPQGNSTDITVAIAQAAFVEEVNLEHARRAHLWLFSGRKADWLVDWMQDPLRRPKMAAKILDEEVKVDSGSVRGTGRILKRQFVVHEE